MTLREIQSSWDAGVIVTRVEGKRHFVMFPEKGTEAKISFCNYCGDEFTRDDVCAGCGENQAA